MSGELAGPLHPEVLAMLDAARRAGARPRSEWTVEETRAAMRAGRAWQTEPPAGVAVRDLDADGVPVRLYGSETAPRALLYLHGGRFFSGDLESHDWPLRQLAHDSGCLICAVDYRLAPEFRHPAALEDAISAGKWLAGRTSELWIGGDSAGGYLAALASRELRPRGQILIYPMLDPACATPSYREFWHGPWPAGEDMRRGWDLYGGEAVAATGDFPPTILITAGTDPLRDEAIALAGGLRALGIEVVDRHFPDMHHGFFTQTKLVRSRELLAFLAGIWD